MLIPINDRIRAPLSTGEPRRFAEMMPSGMPNAAANRIAKSASSRVAEVEQDLVDDGLTRPACCPGRRWHMSR